MPEVIEDQDTTLPNADELKRIVRENSEGPTSTAVIPAEVKVYEFDRPNLGIIRKAIEAISRIRGMIGERSEEGEAGRQISLEELVSLEESPDPHSISIGLEIEIGDSTLLESSEKGLPKEQRKAIVEQRKKELAWLEESGLGVDDTDPWLEFAFEPSNSYLTQLAQLELLSDAGAISLESNFYSLHINLGGISSFEDQTGSEIGVLARALEATGWGASRQRLLMPIKRRTYNLLNKARSWNTPDFIGGYYERHPETYKQNTTVVEFRTLMAHGTENLRRIVEAAYFLGICLSAYQDLHHVEQDEKKTMMGLRTHFAKVPSPRLKKGADYEKAKALSDIWVKFSSEIKIIFQSEGLKDPAKGWKEPKSLLIKRKGDFADLARLLETDANFSEKVGQLVEKYVTEIKSLLGAK